LEAAVSGIEAHLLPLVAAAETTGDGWDPQAVAAAIVVAGGGSGKEE
jgi:hypothetical protein